MNKTSKHTLSPYEIMEYENGGDFFNIMKASAPLISLIPGVGQIAGPIVGGIGAIGGVVSNNITQQDRINEQNILNRKDLFVHNLDSRYLQGYENGGNIIEMPNNISDTDSIPTDAQGNPSSLSGRNAIAMTDSGEVIWNGYVFSDNLGFASKAKSILRRYKLRLGDDLSGKDRISREQMNIELSDLADEQELYKYHNHINDSSEGYVSGGTIHIDESKIGTFTAAANRRNMGVQEFAHQVMSNKERYSPEMVKKANFAINSKSWNKKEYGGFEDPYIPVQDITKLSTKDVSNSYNKQLVPSSFPTSNTFSSSDTSILDNPDLLALFGNLSSAGIQGLIANSTRQTNFTPTSYSPELLNLTEERDALSRNAITNRRMLLNRYHNSKASQIASIVALNEQLADSMSRSYVNERQYNSQITNAQRQSYAQSVDKMKELKEIEKGVASTAFGNMVSNAGASINQYFMDKSKRARDLDMQTIMAGGSNYDFVYTPDGRIIDINVKQ